MVCSPFEKIIRFSPSLDIIHVRVFHVQEKVFILNFSTFFTQKGKNPCDRAPLKELCHGVFIHFSDLTKLLSH